MAQILMARNVKVSNKEIKDALHGAFSSDPTFSLRQSEVSAAMHDLYVEQNWFRELNTTAVPGTPFWEYSVAQAVAVQQPQAATSQPTPAAQTPAINQPATQPLASATSSATFNGTKLDPANGKIVCYIKQDPSKYVQANDRATARKACFLNNNDNMFGLIYDNINTCSVEYFNKHKLK